MIKVSFVILFAISLILHDASIMTAQQSTIQALAKPYEKLEMSFKRYIIPSGDNIISEIREAIQTSKTNLVTTTFIDNDITYFWEITDEAIFNKLDMVEESLDLFNQKITPISNQELGVLAKTYNYHLYPFSQYNENRDIEIVVYAQSEGSIRQFVHILQSKGLNVNEMEQSKIVPPTVTQTYFLALGQNPLMIGLVGLLILNIIVKVYRERRNIGIRLLNGASKAQLFWEWLIQFVKPIFILTSLSFMILCITKSVTNFKGIISCLQVFLLFNGYTVLMVIITVLVVLYSFTDVTAHYYIRGPVKSHKLSLVMIAIKVGLVSLLGVQFIQAASYAHSSMDQWQTIKKESEKYKNIYRLDIAQDAFHSFVFEMDAIYQHIALFPEILYISDFYDENREHSDNELLNRILFVNQNYLNHSGLRNKQGDLINTDVSNVVYTKEKNVNDLENLKKKSSILCETGLPCTDTQIVVVEEKSRITVFNQNPALVRSDTEDDFILVPITQNINALELNIVGDNHEIIDAIEEILPAGTVKLEPLIGMWERELNLVSNGLIGHIGDIGIYALLLVALVSLNYLVLFDRNKKRLAIYWLNGIKEGRMFYRECGASIVINVATVLIVLRTRLTLINSIWLILFMIVLELLALIFSMSLVKSQLNKFIKERE